ncbi:hypothetical protein WG66_004017, partial [Moniliophthora roreri]
RRAADRVFAITTTTPKNRPEAQNQAETIIQPYSENVPYHSVWFLIRRYPDRETTILTPSLDRPRTTPYLKELLSRTA